MAIAEGRTRTTIPVTLDGRWLARSNAKRQFRTSQRAHSRPRSFCNSGASRQNGSDDSRSARRGKKRFCAKLTTKCEWAIVPSEYDTASGRRKTDARSRLLFGRKSVSDSQFSNNIDFQDPNKNRTHDQFANLIKNFGADYPSFGIVAHSQGGAASLHLYTYYWSGLDYATGRRLIQSVGTPYQGTALAGNLAALGSVFGAGCGTNNDLTYSGAASWLAGIPSWARAKVHYSTTSFTDVWYRYDYCSHRHRSVFGDPDDGVIEKAYGQLPGANNRGHKTGWCHTSGMRDPAQTSDSSRNSDMNANAAR